MTRRANQALYQALFHRTGHALLGLGLLMSSAWAAAPDTDGDGISDNDEILLGSNPFQPDTGRLPNYVLYWDDMKNSWLDYSPNKSWVQHPNASADEKKLIAADLHSTAAPPVAGNYVIAMEPTRWRFLLLQHKNIKLDAWKTLELEIHGGTTGGQLLQVRSYGSTLLGQPVLKTLNLATYIPGGKVAANQWLHVRIPLADLLDSSGVVSRLDLGTLSGNPTSVYYLNNISLIADPNPAPPLQISVDAGVVTGSLPHALLGVNGAHWMTDLHADPVVAQVKALGAGPIRYPGGSSSDTFHWQSNNLLNLDRSQSWQTTTDDFFQLLSKSGAAGMITTNFGTGSAREAADWASYAYAKDANVPYWEVGNEIYGNWESSWTHDGTAYMVGDATHDGANTYCKAIKMANPKAQVSMVGNLTATEANSFSANALKASNGCFDYFSVHYYPYGPGTLDYSGLLSIANADIPVISANVRGMVAGNAKLQNLKVALTEYNSYYTQPELPAVQVANMLFMAEVVGQSAMQGFATATAWSLGVTPDAPPGSRYGLLQNYLNLTRQPSYYVYPLWQKSGDQLLQANVNRYASRELSVYASRHSSNGDVTLMVINKSHKAQSGSINLASFHAAGTADVHTVRGSSLDAGQVTWNELGTLPVDLSTVPPVTVDVIGSSLNYSFPPYSISSVTIRSL